MINNNSIYNDKENSVALLNDMLYLVQSLFNDMPPYLRYQKFVIILDTNVVLRDIHWSIKNQLPTALQSCLKNKIATFIGPNQLALEVINKIPECLQKKNFSSQEFLEKWEHSYKPFIHFIEEIDNHNAQLVDEMEALDPKDVEFIKVFEALNADVIMSNDSHFKKLGITQGKYPSGLFVDLRNYADNSVKSLKLFAGIGGLTLISIEGFKFILQLLNKSLY